MNIKSSYYILLLLLFSLGCRKESTRELSNFPKEIKLSGKPIEINSILNPNELIVLDSLLIVQNKNGSSIFQIFSTKNFRKIAELGHVGKGPNEMIYPIFTGQVSKLGDKTFHHFYDPLAHKYIEIDFNGSILKKSLMISENRLGPEMENINKIIFKSNDFLYAIPKRNNDNRLLVFNLTTGNVVNKFPVLPEITFNISNENIANVYLPSGYGVNSFEKKIVLAPSFIGQFDFFDFSGTFLYSTYIAPIDEVLKEKASKGDILKKNVTYYHTRIQQADSLIYALYLPAKLEIMEAWEKPKVNSKILILDWEGHTIQQYQLDRPISSFVLDIENKCIYGHTVFEEPSIIKYELNLDNLESEITHKQQK